jgi:hypothetical protein
MLSYLDYSNVTSILASKNFKLNILKDCILLGAHQTQLDIQKLPSALKKAATSNDVNFQKDFMHPLWLASSQFLFDLLQKLCLKLPAIPIININTTCKDYTGIYQSKLGDFALRTDFYSYLSPITEAINAYLKSIRQYPCLVHQLKINDQANSSKNKLNNLITYIIFQINFISYLSSKKNHFVTMNALNHSFLCLFNLLADQNLLESLCQHVNYSTLISYLLNDFYLLLMAYFFQPGDENLIHTPTLSPKQNIDYSMGIHLTNDILFSTGTFEILLKLRFLVTNYCSNSSSNGSETSTESNDSLSSMKSTFCANNLTHRFLQHQSNFFRKKFPFNMIDLIEKIYLSLCRLPILERFIRIPDSLWRMSGFKMDYGQFLKSDSSALPPLEYLRDPQILKEHLKHVLCVGWTTRTQFEYEYVNMLTLLHNLSDDSYLPQSSSTQPDSIDDSRASIPVEEIKERNKCICLVIKGLSSWLIKSTLAPKSGSSLNSLYEQVSRNKVPQFLHSQLGRQYCQVKRIIESFGRNNLFTKMNSITIANNPQLLYMLDPTLIDEIDRSKRKATANLVSASNRPLDFTQPQPTADALANLFQISMNLSHRDYNLLFSTNIERNMIQTASNPNSFYYYTQISLEGHLKFLGQWNQNSANKQQATTTAASIAATLSNLATSVGGGAVGGIGNTTNSNLVEEMSAKTANAILKVAEFLSEDTDLISRASSSSGNNLDKQNQDQDPTFQQSQLIQRSFNRNNLDITSVLRTVLDYYESFFRNPCLQLKLDIFKSILYLANSLFDSKHQYESLMMKLQNNFEWLTGFIQQDNNDQSQILMPIVNELIDESVLSLAIYAECLCRCCLQTSKNDYTASMPSKELDRLNKLFENGFKSNSLSIKIATVHGMIYWLESITLGYLLNTNDTKLITDHLSKQINLIKNDLNIYLTLNSRYVSTLWSAVFYAIENCLDSIRDAQTFVSTFIKLTYQILNDVNTPFFLFSQLCMGLERFLLSSMVPSFEINTIQRFFTSKFYDEQRSLCLTSLIITSLYASNQSKQVNYWNDIVKQPTNNQSNISASNSLNNMNNFSPNTSLPESPSSEHPPSGFNLNRDQSTFGNQDTGKYKNKFNL